MVPDDQVLDKHHSWLHWCPSKHMATMSMYVCFLLNHCFSELICCMPMRACILQFYQWHQPTPLLQILGAGLLQVGDSNFPSDSCKLHRHWVGVAENVGHAMSFKILTDNTHKVLHRSNIQMALTQMALTPDEQIFDWSSWKMAMEWILCLVLERVCHCRDQECWSLTLKKLPDAPFFLWIHRRMGSVSEWGLLVPARTMRMTCTEGSWPT